MILKIGWIILSAFVILLGLSMLTSTGIPAWFVGLSGIAAGVFILIGVLSGK